WAGGILPQARPVLAEINDMRAFRWLAALVGGLLASPLFAAAPRPPLLGDGSLDSLAGSLRGYLVQALPNPLLETKTGWGHQDRVANGLKWRGQGLRVHPEVQ